MNLKPIHSFKSSAVVLIVGIASGFATAAAARFGSELNPFIGVFFGGAVFFILWIEHKKCSAWLVTAVLASSVASYCAAIWGTLFLSGMVGRLLGPENNFPDLFGPRTFSIAGFIGALILNLAILLQLSPKRGLSILWKAAGWALAGALLGCISAELRNYVGAGMKAVIGVPWTDMGTNDYYMSLYSAYLIWQTGMLLLIPRVAASASIPQPTDGAAGAQLPTRVSWAGKLFFAVIFCAVVVLGYSLTLTTYRSMQYQHSVKSRMKAYAERQAAAQKEQQDQMALSVAEAPPGLETLSTLMRPAKAVLILSKIGIYSPKIPLVMERSSFKNPRPDRYVFPSRVNYSMYYEGVSAEGGSSSRQIATVIITQYPNNDWAQYELRNTPKPNMKLWNLPAERLRKFGNPIMRYRQLRSPPMYYWTSGDKIIIVHCNTEDDTVLEKYLMKYPSSLD